MTARQPGTSRTIGQAKQAAARCGLSLEDWQARRDAGLARCYRCTEWKAADAFARDASRPTGRASICKGCNSIRSLRSRYGLSETELAALPGADGHCGICQRDDQPMRIDHCHHTGKVRGMICNRCNVGLGQFLDDPALMTRAIAYLENHK